MMKLTWYGHSCFLLETAEGSVVFDPYAPGSVPGLALPELTADAVLCSHGHRDHGFAEAVRLSGKQPAFRVTAIDSFHDDKRGLLRGKNTIYVVEAEGKRVAHLGDLGHELNEKQLAALGKIDLLLIPVGGFFTIGPEEACAVLEQLQPRVAVPMHYRRGGMGYDVLSTLESFLEKWGAHHELPGNTLDILPETAGLYVLNR